MAEFKISRIRYTWRGGWLTGTSYIKDDIVRYGGSAWVCIRSHSASAFAADQTYRPLGATDPLPAWTKMADGYQFRGEWSYLTSSTPTVYNTGDVVLYGGVLYLCTANHTATTFFDTTISSWTVYTSLYSWANDWAENVRYGIGDVVRYNGTVYRCVTGHTSAPINGGIEQDQAHWTILNSGVEYRGDWVVGTRYMVNDLVKFGGSVWRCKKGHTHADDSTMNFDSNEHWNLEFPGYQRSGEWSMGIVYQLGDIVQHGGTIYYALTNSYNSNPSASNYQTQDRVDPPDWQVLSQAINLRGDWNSSTQYKTGDVVRRGGYTYIALIDTSVAADGSSLDYLDSSNWEIVVPGDDHKPEWTIGSTYARGDLVTYEGTLWRSNFEHIASEENWPSLDSGSGFLYWDIVLLSGSNVGMKNRGDLLTFDLSRSLAGDGSTLNETSVPIGNTDELAMVNDVNSVYYKVWGHTDKVRYVSSDDSVALDDDTDPERGVSPFKPWRTIRYACEHVENSTEGSEQVTIKVSTGIYEEVLPIIVPAGTAIVGDELRAVTVTPMPAIAALDGDLEYSLHGLDRVSGIIQNIFNGTPVTKSVGNSETQIFPQDVLTYEPFIPPQYDTNGDELFQAPISVLQATDIQNLIVDIKQYLNFYVGGTGTEPTMYSTNNVATGSSYLNAVTMLELNKEFIAAEASAYVAAAYPAFTFDQARCKRDIKKYIEAFKYDILRDSNYKSLLYARYYRNAVLGSEGEDMFYVRNSTGLRNMTLKGLTGVLNPPRVYEIYQRPTGGAFVSLDPGWGPDDERVWITTRSCYVQNVTTFGTAAIGQKIDGSLHNGGNRSIVSNDFTQVISDGIGAWVLNNGRAELVSVFTYYCNIGMFAENGGIIRATNGNSSYGNIGSLADGNDPTEVPYYAEVNNRITQASVADAFAGEINDEILMFEFEHAGENYSTATYTIVGSGINASVIQDEFRDNAVFEMMVRNDPQVGSGVPGGSGYSLFGNNAQGGNLTSITLASNDDHDEAEVLGLRLVITSGDGTGQYGYVTAYNTVTKVAQISRESTGEPGWDHVVPGKPLVSLITTNATYRLEPRITFSEPEYSSTDINLTITDSWANIVFGETESEYLDIAGSVGSGTTVDVVPVTATWNITKSGREYIVTLQQGGAGYQVGQEITIDGSDVGGLSIEHDVTITVQTVSDDSTNSIVSFTYAGVAQSGVFVATPAIGGTGAYSFDGSNWNSTTLPAEGNWRGLAWGNNTFVAIRAGGNTAAISNDGINWTTSSLPASGLNWRSVVFGSGIFLAIAGDDFTPTNTAAISYDNGATWVTTTLPAFGDSTYNVWIDAAYGRNKFVVLANSGNISAIGTWNSLSKTMSWTGVIMDVVADSSSKDWVSIAWGNNRFVAISSTGDIAYTFDTETWIAGTMPTQDGSTAHNWKSINYGQGTFMALGDTGSRTIGDEPTTGPTTYAATSPDGVTWTSRVLSTASEWRTAAFGNPDITLGDSTASNPKPMWIAISDTATNLGNKIITGTRALGRAVVEAGRITSIKIWEPGSGYASPPTYTITDPNNVTEAYIEPRLGDGVLGQPTWINRGTNYKTSSTRVSIIGDGYADRIPNGAFVTVSGLTVLPGPGTQFRFRGETDYFTVTTVEYENQDVATGLISGTFRISPTVDYDYYLEHGGQVEIRERYSQVRITGHDFLDVGSGNYLQTNYPELYTLNTYFSAPENEVVELNGGRVFYTSTDQSGNFRTGELFAVEQATGVVTISADFFDLQGLTELALGGVRLGGSGAVVREFSKDPLFTADSNNIIPTQKAIKSYLANRLNVGGSDLLTASFIAGTVKVGPNLISNSAQLTVIFPEIADFSGRGTYGASVHTSGTILAQTMFYRSFNQD